MSRVIKRAAIVAMRSLAENGGLVFDPKHARNLRTVPEKYLTITPVAQGTAPRPYFCASLTPKGAEISRHHKHNGHAMTADAQRLCHRGIADISAFCRRPRP
jgi:hypothetical protein